MHAIQKASLEKGSQSRSDKSSRARNARHTSRLGTDCSPRQLEFTGVVVMPVVHLGGSLGLGLPPVWLILRRLAYLLNRSAIPRRRRAVGSTEVRILTLPPCRRRVRRGPLVVRGSKLCHEHLPERCAAAHFGRLLRGGGNSLRGRGCHA